MIEKMDITIDGVKRSYANSHSLAENAGSDDLVKVASRICGLNAQTARGPYISLWSRIKGFKREHLTKAFHEDRRFIKTWLMRGTAHMVVSSEFPIYQKALRRGLLEEWERIFKRHGPDASISVKTRLERAILKHLESASLTKKELMPLVEHVLVGQAEKERKTVISWTLRTLSYRGLVCHARPTGTWYHFKDNRFTTVERWSPGLDVDRLDERHARRDLLLKYLHGYGPATIQDFAYWTGLKVTASRQTFEDARDRISEIKVKDVKRTHWVLNSDLARLPRLGSKKKIPVRFLPEFDPLIMGHKDKSPLLDERHKKSVFLRLADVEPVVMIDGRARGTWTYKVTDRSFVIRLFERLDPNTDGKMRREGRRLVAFLAS